MYQIFIKTLFITFTALVSLTVLSLPQSVSQAYAEAPESEETAITANEDAKYPTQSVFSAGIAPVFATQILSMDSERSGIAGILRGGKRYQYLGWFFELQLATWLGYEGTEHTTQASGNFGVGLEGIYFDRHIRSAISFGTAVLLKKADPDEEGTVGIYIDIDPASYVFHPWKKVNLVLSPISLYVGMPSLKGIPLVVIQYRTTLAVEFTL